MVTYPNHLSNGDLGDPAYINAIVDDLHDHKTVMPDTVVGSSGDYANVQAALNAGHKSVWLQNELFLIDQPIVPPSDDISIMSNGAQIRAHSAMARVIDIRSVRAFHLNGVFLNGYGLATKCLDGMHADWVPVHRIKHSKFWGATDCQIDLTGCEDSSLFDFWCDGRKEESSPVTLYGDYGLRIGQPGDGYQTGGQLNFFDGWFGFHKKADVYLKNIWHAKFHSGLFASKVEWSASFQAHMILEGGTGPYAMWPSVVLLGPWFDGAIGTHPNILIQNVQASGLTIVGGQINSTDAPNIYSTLNPGLEILEIFGGKMERNAGGPNIQCPTRDVNIIGPLYIGGTGLDKTNVTKYLEIKAGAAGAYGPGAIDTNRDILLNDQLLQDPKNLADATLSGTPKIVEIKIGGVSYYVKVYPTKT
jgi:hypothetical protein